MTIYVFLGPTLSTEAARRELDAIYLPPVAQGDVYRVGRERPSAIGIVDGYFERVPSVWHKEILWAMKEGIHVFGSASMGALRAAELAPFGMEGVGWIFQAYHDGTLTDDDEVAVAHGPAESGYVAISEAMVNIRRTLASAHAAGVIGSGTHELLERVAKALFYPDRSYPSILRLAAEQGAPSSELETFRAWLPGGRVDQKRYDALAMLRQMREWSEAAPARKHVRYSFAHTDGWEILRQQSGDLATFGDAGADVSEHEALLDELRLDPKAFADVRLRTMVRQLADRHARQRGFAVSPEARLEAIESFRRERGLLRPEQLEEWLAQRHMSREEFTRLIEEEAQLRWVRDQLASTVMGRISDELRLEDGYPELRARSREQWRRWEAQGLQRASLSDLGLTEDGILEWYFGERLGRAVPANVGDYAQSAGFADKDAFCRAVLREFWYASGAGTADRPLSTALASEANAR